MLEKQLFTDYKLRLLLHEYGSERMGVRAALTT